MPISERIKINLGATAWKYIRDSDPPEAMKPGFDDSGWQSVGIPHSINENEMFSNTQSGGGAGFMHGQAWYRKHFTLPGSYAGRKILVEFEGAHTGVQVYVNGQLVRGSSAFNKDATHVNGFLPFVIDITDMVKTDGSDNVMAVKVAANANFFENPDFSGGFRFGQGDTGIFRPVYMYVTNRVHIPQNVYPVLNTWGTYIATESIADDRKSARVRVETNLLNETSEAQQAVLTTQIVDVEGQVVAQTQDTRTLPANPASPLRPTGIVQYLNVANPVLWFPNNSKYGRPYMYRVNHIVSINGVVVDASQSPLGIRTITWDKDFPIINGYAHHLWGASGRYDYPALGTAVPEEQQWRDLKLLADAGGNIYRPGHSASSPEFVAAADALGVFIVQPSGDGENGFAGSCYRESQPTTDCPQNLINKYPLKLELHREMIVRDRSNPSILGWEANNGVMDHNFAQEVRQVTNQWDPVATRAQVDRTPDDRNGDVLGCSRESCELNVKDQFPNKPAWSAEYWGRGEFRESYDYEIAMAAPFMDDWRRGVVHNAFGIAHWYLAETPGETSTFWSGVEDKRVRSLGDSMMDGGRLPKLLYYTYKAAWTPYTIRPVVHLAHHWNRSGTVRVNAFSNCPAVNLYVNGKQQGTSQIPNSITVENNDTSQNTTGLVGQVHWDNVKFEPGTLTAQCLDEFGTVKAEDSRVTAGAADHLELVVEPALQRPDGSTFKWTANGSDAVFITARVVDANGVVVPDASNTITFNVSDATVANYRGGWNHIVTNPDDFTPKNLAYHSPGDHELAAEGGLQRIAIRTTFKPGTVTVTATSPGLGAGRATYAVEASNPQVQGISDVPVVLLQPQDQLVSAGQPARFAVMATGAGPLGFQWLRNGTPIPGATASTLVTPATALIDTDTTFSVNVTNAKGVVQSRSAKLTVYPPVAPSFDTQIADQSLIEGAPVVFEVKVSGSPELTFQWLRNDVAIDGATDARYEIAAASMRDNGAVFKVRVTNPVAQVVSLPATLTVKPAEGLEIGTQPLNQVAALNQSAKFSVTLKHGSEPVKYEWRGPRGVVGTNKAELLIESVQSTDFGNYSVTITNAAGSVSSQPATLSQAAPGVNLARGKVAFASSYQNEGGMPASNVTDGNVSTPWGSAIPAPEDQDKPYEATITVDLGAPLPFNDIILRWEAAHASKYQVDVSNDNKEWRTVFPSGDNAPGGVEEFGFPTTTARYVRVTGQKRATQYGYSLYEVEVYNVATCGPDTERYSVVDQGHVRDNQTTLLWNRAHFTLTGDQQLTQAKAALYCRDQGARLPTREEAVSISGRNAASCAFPKAWKTWTSNNVPGDDRLAYWVSSGGDVNVGTADNLPGWALCVAGTPQVKAPQVTVQPAGLTATVGTSAHFAVGASGTDPLTYVWFRNRTQVQSSASPFYDTPVLTLDDNGSQFYVVVSNSAGTVTSQEVTLTVKAATDPGNGNPQQPGQPPVIVMQPADQAAAIGKTATFTVGATLPAGHQASYQWERDGQPIAGATAANYTTAPVTLDDNGARFGVQVRDGNATTLSNAAVLSVVDGVPSTSDNLALHKDVHASGNENPVFSDPKNVVDGDPESRWSSDFNDDAYIDIDLGRPQAINKVELLWQLAYGKAYRIEVSIDGNDWKTVYNQKAGRGGEEKLSFQTVMAQHVRMQGVKRNTEYGYSLFEFRVFGPQLSIVTQPVAQTVTQGQSAHFSLSVIGSPELSYQWFKNGERVATTSEPSYDTPATTAADNGAVFAVVASVGNSQVKSDDVVLTVLPSNHGGGDNGNGQNPGGNPQQPVDPTPTPSLSLGKRAYSSGVESPIATPAINAIDGRLDTRWASDFHDDAWLTVDLGVPGTVTGVGLRWERAYGAAYLIQTSGNGQDWTTVYTQNAGQGGNEALSFTPVQARYVRMQGVRRASQYGYSLHEFEIYGTPASGTVPPQPVDLAQGRATVASGSEDAGRLGGALAVDGKDDTRWSSDFHDNAWIYVDLGSVQPVGQVVLNWERAYGAAYSIQLSSDAQTWNTVYNQTAGSGGLEHIRIDAAQARYVRMQGVRRGTDYGYSLEAFEVYAPQDGQIPPTQPDPQPQPKPPVIQTQPVNVAVTVGAAARFSVAVAQADGLSYQWSRNGQAIAGATGSSYVLAATTLADNGAVFTVTVTNAAGLSTTSQPATLVVQANEGGTTPPNPGDDDGTTVPDYTVYPNALGVALKNRTHGKFSDDQVYVAVIARDPNENGRFVYLTPDGTPVPMTVADNEAANHLTKNGQNYSNYFFTLAQSKLLKMPKLDGGRIFVSLGSPMYIKVNEDINHQVGFAGPNVLNPTDPNIDVHFDWYEFTYNNIGLWLNNTQVDQFGFPLVEDVYGDNRTWHQRTGIVESRDVIMAAYAKEVPPEFMVTKPTAQRIMAPAKGSFDEGQVNGHYFDAYVNQVWDYYRTHTLRFTLGAQQFTAVTEGEELVFTTVVPQGSTEPPKVYRIGKPNTQEILEGKGKLASGDSTELQIETRLCAGFNRHIMEDASIWDAHTAGWYATGPYNAYAKFWHDHSVDGKAYGFSYDDVSDQSSTIMAPKPEHVVLGIGW
ncbi:discoidin domain-containing protein [Stenotrophomonas sp. 24(2023)]|uniref:discoidin domain-containing protein n=1 Tax=Stenotrophomonas sp. 24(2023) TaxID=3068324 RepID=UPI0027E1C5A5|nr:discoidin domain-containing protein [Stenotrophomonas sp. 24(2023)]WMJ70182.1 discoidin domain-containing protein [Stenotrophomonas sp. 24(2023)]